MIQMIAETGLNAGSAVSFITGAGGAIAFAWFWISQSIKEKKIAREDAKEVSKEHKLEIQAKDEIIKIERETNKLIGEGLLLLSAELKPHIMQMPKSLEDLIKKLGEEHTDTRKVVVEEVKGLKCKGGSVRE